MADVIKSRRGMEYSLSDALRRNPTLIRAGDDICAVAADRIAALEAELQEARMQGLAAAGQAQDHMEKVAALVEENARLRKALNEAITWDSHDAEGVAAVWLDQARAALQENDN